MNKVKRYIETCHTCLKTKLKYKKNRPILGRIPTDYASMQDLSIDIKHMPTAILIKLKVQVPMSLYSVDTVPIPLDAETYTGAK